MQFHGYLLGARHRQEVAGGMKACCLVIAHSPFNVFTQQRLENSPKTRFATLTTYIVENYCTKDQVPIFGNDCMYKQYMQCANSKKGGAVHRR